MPSVGPQPGGIPRARARSQTRVARLMAARLLLCLAVLAVTWALPAQRGEALRAAATNGLHVTLALAFLATAGFGVLRRRVRQGRFAAAQIAADVGVVTALVHFTGGSESLFAFLYVLVVVFGGMLAQRRGAFGAALACAAALGGVLLASQRGWIGDYGSGLETPGALVLTAWSVHAGALVLVAWLASHLSRELESADQRLHRSESRLHLLRSLHERTVESLMSGLLTTDLTGRVTSFNQEAERITGIPVGQALGRDLDDVLPGARERVMVPAADAASPARLRQRMLFRDGRGEELHLGLAGSILRGEDGEARGTVVIFQDVTHVVEMEGELRRSERLAAVGQLAADIAHEVRNPLAAISGSVQILLDEGGGARPPGERARLRDIVLRETDRLNTLITDFLQYAHPRPPKPEQVVVEEVVGEVLEMLAAQKRPGLRVERELGEGLRVFADRAQLTQLLWNLCANAVQAMPEGGTLRLAAQEGAALSQDARIADRRTNEEAGRPGVELRVADTGVGIPPEVSEQIFDPFFTTKPEGTGLGLATVHRIVEGNGGSLRVESAVGVGTTFSIWLPAATEAEAS